MTVIERRPLNDAQEKMIVFWSRNLESSYPNVRARQIVSKWQKDSIQLPPEIKDQIGDLYLSKILQIDEETIEQFKANSFEARHEIGMKSGGAQEYKPDQVSFWQEVTRLVPDMLTEEEVKFILKEDKNVGSPNVMIETFDNVLPNSKVIRKILVNQHVFK